MKKIILLMGAFMFLVISCSSNKYVAKSNSDDDIAKTMISVFPTHKYRFLKMGKLRNTSSFLDIGVLRDIINNPNVDSIKFFLAAEIDKGAQFRYPTVVLQIISTDPSQPKGKGSNLMRLNYQYKRTITLCPPPPGGCRIEPQ